MDDQASGRSAKVSSEAAVDWVELEHRELPNSASSTMHKKTFLLLLQLLSTTSSSSAHLSAAKLTNIENAISVTKDRVISESILESGETAKDGLSPLIREDFNLVTKFETNPTKRSQQWWYYYCWRIMLLLTISKSIKNKFQELFGICSKKSFYKFNKISALKGPLSLNQLLNFCNWIQFFLNSGPLLIYSCSCF